MLSHSSIKRADRPCAGDLLQYGVSDSLGWDSTRMRQWPGFPHRRGPQGRAGLPSRQDRRRLTTGNRGRESRDHGLAGPRPPVLHERPISGGILAGLQSEWSDKIVEDAAETGFSPWSGRASPMSRAPCGAPVQADQHFPSCCWSRADMDRLIHGSGKGGNRSCHGFPSICPISRSAPGSTRQSPCSWPCRGTRSRESTGLPGVAHQPILRLPGMAPV